MTLKLLVSSLLLLTACGKLSAQQAAPEAADSEGMFQKLLNGARSATASFQAAGSTALGLAATYYEDHVQPLTNRYTQWGSDVKNSVWEKIQTTMSNYSPLKLLASSEQS